MALRTVKKILATALDIACPGVCLSCGALLEGPWELPLCGPCTVEANFAGDMMCPRCGAGVTRDPEEMRMCPKCHDLNLNFERAVSLAPYEGPMGQVVRALKFRGRRALAGPLGRMLAAILRRQDFTQHLDVIVPVPIHWRRRFKRGFNQSELIAQSLGRALGLPVEGRNLRRIRHTKPQTRLSRRERLSNLKGAFRVRRPGAFKDRNVLLVDDVMTTGGTITECSREIRKAGAKQIYAAFAAR